MEHFIEQLTDEKCPCRKKNESRKRQPVPVLLSILIAVLPKCPFCVFGYSSVMVLCSGTRIYDQNPVSYWYLPVMVAVAAVFSLWWNYRGQRTRWALALAVAGGVVVAFAARLGASEPLYYTGAGMIFLGVFVNGSFMPFWRKAKTYFHVNF